jgi:hypothetical protein
MHRSYRNPACRAAAARSRSYTHRTRMTIMTTPCPCPPTPPAPKLPVRTSGASRSHCVISGHATGPVSAAGLRKRYLTYAAIRGLRRPWPGGVGGQVRCTLHVLPQRTVSYSAAGAGAQADAHVGGGNQRSEALAKQGVRGGAACEQAKQAVQNDGRKLYQRRRVCMCQLLRCLAHPAHTMLSTSLVHGANTAHVCMPGQGHCRPWSG